MRLWAEFLAFYLAAPLLIAVALPPDALFPGLFAMTAAGLVLLAVTPGFSWGELLHGIARIGWRLVLAFAATTAAVAYVVVHATEPAAFLFLPREMPQLMLLIAVLYPPLSALPQEIVFRPLFFRRYGALLPAAPHMQVLLNAGLFAAAHLMYWSWIVGLMTFAGGLAFAWSYRIRGNFPEALLLHSVAGLIVFMMGLGIFFYSGNVQRPF